MPRANERPPPPGRGVEPLPSRTPVWTIGPTITHTDVPALCEQLVALLRDARVVICDVAAVTAPGAVSIEALARLKLTAARLGCHIRFRGAGDELRELLVLFGLREVLPLHAGLGLEPGVQTEQREQPYGVEEGVEPDDLAS